MSTKRLIWPLLWLALAIVSLYLFVTRYWLYRDCIAAAASSCVTTDGANLTSGGMFWGVLALGFAIAAGWTWRRRR